jgi:single-stranded-DNA-specific exonuclease
MVPRYTLKKQPGDSVRKELSAYDEFTQNLLFVRNIVSGKDADDFFNPMYGSDAHNPFLLTDMEAAVARIIQAIDTKEKIALYTDFDADGIPAGALLHDALAKIGHEQFLNYIPHRDSEGYGFHKEAVDALTSKGVTLIITADVGISDSETSAYAQEKGVDVIITDHHIPGEKLPEAIAVVNPQRVDDFYPCVHLSGSGVAFKLVQGLYQRAREDKKKWMEGIPESWEKWLLDLVAIATVADMVPLVGENRSLVHYGLLVLQKSPRPGIRAVCTKLRIAQRFLTEDDISFSIAPRINASSRMGSPETAFELLTTTDVGRAADLAVELESLNNKRKGQVAQIVRELHKKIPEVTEHAIVVAGNPNWNPALLGLAANSLVERHKKTVCLWGREGTGNLKGSCRGNGDVHVVEMFKAVSDKLSQFGGHEYAGGFSIEHDDVHDLQEIFDEGSKKAQLQKEEATVAADAELDYTKLKEVHRVQQRFAPFGIANPKPVFVCRDVHIHSVRQFGKEGSHIEIGIGRREFSERIRAIAFFKSPSSFTKTPVQDAVATIICTLELSRFAGRVQFELRIVDIV